MNITKFAILNKIHSQHIHDGGVDHNINNDDDDKRNSTPKPSALNLLLNGMQIFTLKKSLSTIEEVSESEKPSSFISMPVLNNKANSDIDVNHNIKRNTDKVSPLSENVQSINHSASNESLASTDIISNISSLSYKDDYNPCSSNSSRKGCYNYQCSENSETEMDTKNEIAS
eukprot:jgi/Orpsp1_1/1177743/evm.model.c7180000062657.1